MVSIVKYLINNNDKLPNQLINLIFNYADLCSSIIKISTNGIEVYDFNTLEKKHEITCRIFEFSASQCGTFVAGSNNLNNVCIWNMMNGEIVQVIKFSGNWAFFPKHIFTSTNELLVAINRQIFSFNYCKDTTTWVHTYTYEIPLTSGMILNIKHNTYHSFACGTVSGHIYVFDTQTKKITHALEQMISGVTNEINYLTFIKDKLAACSSNGTYMCIDIKTGTFAHLEKPQQENSYSKVFIENILITPSLTQVIGTVNSKTYVWDFSTGNIVKVLDICVLRNSTFTPGGTKLVSTDRISSINVIHWNV
jgi:WD40 repeat protein